jgi:hypothetical protein
VKGTVLRGTRDPSPLAPGPGSPQMDSTPSTGVPEHPRRQGSDHPPIGPREPHLGLSPNPRRVGQVRGVIPAPWSVWVILRRHGIDPSPTVRNGPT